MSSLDSKPSVSKSKPSRWVFGGIVAVGLMAGGAFMSWHQSHQLQAHPTLPDARSTPGLASSDARPARAALSTQPATARQLAVFGQLVSRMENKSPSSQQSIPVAHQTAPSRGHDGSNEIFKFSHPGQSYEADIGPAGVKLRLQLPGAANSRISVPELAATLSAIGRDGGMDGIGSRTVTQQGAVVEVRNENVSEWFRNEPRGLEQGFTIQGRPEQGRGALRLDLSFSSEWQVQSGPDTHTLLLSHGASMTRLRYEGLKAFDATGRRLEAHFERGAETGDVSVLVADAGAVYPVTVDPTFVTEAVAGLPVTAPYGSRISNLVTMGNAVFFVAEDPAYGIELWRSDGTAAGTNMVKDIGAGALPAQPFDGFTGGDSYSSFPSSLVTMNGLLYFVAIGPDGNSGIWVSDGTAAGTQWVTNVAGGGPLAVAGNRLYFIVNTYGTTSQLWTCDGTAAGTISLKSNLPGNGFYESYPLSPAGSTLYFLTSSGKLWKSTGTVGSTMEVKDFGSAYIPATNVPLKSAGDLLYFGLMTGSTQVWRSDGTAGGTIALATVTNLNPVSFTGSGSQMFFTSGYSGSGYTLWRSNGTAGGTTALSTISNYLNSSAAPVLTAHGSGVYFKAHTDSQGFELWRSDGTVPGTAIVKDIQAGSSSSSPINITAAGGWIYFLANYSLGKYELWRSDGTGNGTTYLGKQVELGEYADVKPVGTADGRLFYVALDPSRGKELWMSDGTGAGTGVVKNINGGSSVKSAFGSPVVMGSSVYFTADDGVHGSELWKSDGTPTGTVMVKDIVSGAESSSPSNLCVVNGQLLFFAYYSLWKSDGSEAGTVAIAPVMGPTVNDDKPMVVMGSTLYFSGTDGNDRELWKTDGTTAGTQLVKNIAPGDSSSPMNLTVFNGAIYFSATDGYTGRELWKSDGTAAGTVLVKDIVQYSSSSNPYYFTVIPGALCFVATSNTGYRQLFKTDGTEGGTVQIKTIANSYDDNLQDLRAFGSLLCLVATHPYNPGTWELWRSDGSTAGTTVVRTFPYTNSALQIHGSQRSLEMAEAGGKLYFMGNQAATGRELWKTDLTIAGTQLVKDIWPGAPDATPLGLAGGSQGQVFFSAADPTHGYELWRSDGTEAGTVMVEDLMPGSDSSQPVALTPAGDRLYYLAAASGVAGWQLRMLSPAWQLLLNAPGGGGTLGGAGNFADGAAAPIVATPAPGHVFTGWSGTGVAVPTAASTSVAMTADRNITASFAPVPDLSSWAAGYGLSGGNTDPLAKPAGDGVANLIKYGFNLNPSLPDLRVSSAAGLPGLPLIFPTSNAGGPVLRIEFLRRRGAALTYLPEMSNSLSAGSWEPVTATPIITPIDAFWERVVIEAPLAGDAVGRCFGRVRITVP